MQFFTKVCDHNVQSDCLANPPGWIWSFPKRRWMMPRHVGFSASAKSQPEIIKDTWI